MKFELSMEDFTIIQNAIHYYKQVEKCGNFQAYDIPRCEALRDKLAEQMVQGITELTAAMEVERMMKELSWDPSDEIAVEVGGTVVSGIHQPEGANPKWSRQFGDRGYNKEAFIVVKNKTRSPVISSQPPTHEETTDVADGDNDANNSGSGPT